MITRFHTPPLGELERAARNLLTYMEARAERGHFDLPHEAQELGNLLRHRDYMAMQNEAAEKEG